MHVLALAGRDAAAFAQAQFTSDVTALQDGHWQWSAWLTPKGRVVALFLLLRVDAERYWLLLPDADPHALATQLQRFVFRAKVRLEALPLAVVGVHGVVSSATTIALQFDAMHWLLPLDRDGRRAWRLEPPGESPDATASFDARWRLTDIAHGLPRLQGTAVEAYTPQMLGLDRLAAYSLKKGCYPGQEIVSRTHYLGQAKRGLARVRLLAPAAVGERLQSDTGANAEVVCSAASDGIEEALVVATIEPPAARWCDADGRDRALPLPLLDGLLH